MRIECRKKDIRGDRWPATGTMFFFFCKDFDYVAKVAHSFHFLLTKKMPHAFLLEKKITIMRDKIVILLVYYGFEIEYYYYP